MNKRALLCLAIIPLLISCVTVANPRNFVLKEGEGAMVCRISSETLSIFSLNLASDSGLAPVVKVKRGDPAKILIVKEGEYHFYNISIGYASAEFPFAKPFRVEAGRINYVGDFTYESVGGARINMGQFDNRDKTMADAYRQIPAMLEYPLVSIFE